MWFILLGKAEPERVQTGVVAANYFDVLGVTPILGRTFRPGEDKPGSEPLLLLSYDYWMRSWGGDREIVGRTLKMNDRMHTVIGVLPPMPAYPDDNDVYMPVSACPFRGRPEMSATTATIRHGAGLRAVEAGRLARGGARGPRRASGRASPPSTPATIPAKASGFAVTAVSSDDELTQAARPTFLVLFGIVGLGAAARLRERRQPDARPAPAPAAGARAALGRFGAGRLRLTRQLVTESTLVALAGGALGLSSRPAACGLLVSFAARFTPRAREIAIDGPVLLFALAVSLVTGIAFGLIPAVSSRRQPDRGAAGGRSRSTVGHRPPPDAQRA